MPSSSLSSKVNRFFASSQIEQTIGYILENNNTTIDDYRLNINHFGLYNNQ